MRKVLLVALIAVVAVALLTGGAPRAKKPSLLIYTLHGVVRGCTHPHHLWWFANSTPASKYNTVGSYECDVAADGSYSVDLPPGSWKAAIDCRSWCSPKAIVTLLNGSKTQDLTVDSVAWEW